MEPVSMDIDTTQQLPADPLPFARSYQLEALEKAQKHNTIVFLETGSGKTLIAIMLLRSYAYLLRKPSRFIAVFLVPKVVLVSQQAGAVEMHTDLKVGMYWGEMGVDFWNAATWKNEIDKHEVLVMTPQILLNGLRHSYIKLEWIKVMIFDECHHTSGKHPYACIMTEFFHCELKSGHHDLPRIFGMTASPIKSKGANSELDYWHQIRELEDIMNSKIYTCGSESALAEFIPFSTPKFIFYEHMKIPDGIFAYLLKELGNLRAKHEHMLEQLDLNESATVSIRNKISKVHSALMFCLEELGVWLAFQAAQFFSHCDTDGDFISGGKLDVSGETIVKNFCQDASLAISNCFSAGQECSNGDNIKAHLGAGLLTSKILCLVESLLQYRDLKEIRCIVFVERVITAVVLESLLSKLLPKHSSWKTKYIAGNNSRLQSQTRKIQNEIVEEFRKGMVNIIIATSILEEGLDVQSCNLVIRFDPSATVSSYIQSRGRARKQNSDYLLMVKRGDFSTQARLENYLASGDIMRRESLRHAYIPCSPLLGELDDEFYRVEGTGAVVTLSSSVSLIYFYCSRLPSDRYFKPAPRCIIDKETMTCTLHLPKSSPVQTICVQGNIKTLKQKACLEACKKLHVSGALTDNLVPDIVMKEAVAEDVGNERYDDEQPIYLPPELVSQGPQNLKTKYYCYLIELNQNFAYDIPVHDVVLVVRTELESDVIRSMGFDLEAERGLLTVNLRYIGDIDLEQVLVLFCRRFQITLFKVLLDHSVNKLKEVLEGLDLGSGVEIDYFLLPAFSSRSQPSINWTPISSVLFSYKNEEHFNCSRNGNAHVVQTKCGPVCACVLQNSLVCTPHNGNIYCITGVFEDLNGNSLLKMGDGGAITYKEYFAKRHGIQLLFNREPLLKGKHIFPVHNLLNRCRKQKEKESKNTHVELPPELCEIILSPISISTLYSYTFIPSIMHRLESLLIAVNLKKMHSDHYLQNVNIPSMKVLEAITTNKCQEKFNLESLETLGDSFLKYAASQQLFKIYQNHHEGLLSFKKDKIISNAALCRRGCNHKLQGFIRNESFDPKLWIIPGGKLGSDFLSEEPLSEGRKIYIRGRRKVKSKTIADVVEALIGAYLSTGGEVTALLFMDWIGIKVDFMNTPYERHIQLQAEKFVNVRYLESLLNYSFNDPSLLVEALTHGSYMLPEIPRCYQRLEFLGDSVLDYLITLHMYKEYPGMSPGLLTDLRSASVNNDCYAQSAVKVGLDRHILHASHDLHKHIVATVKNFQECSLESTFGWESETVFPKVLGDVIESLAGAILVDSGYKKEAVFESIRPLLEPLITPETLRLQPVRELIELCQRQHFDYKKPIVSRNGRNASVTIEVEANGRIFKHTATVADKKTAKKLASKEVLKALKESNFATSTASKAE
ncbi:endoribonuclease Dicer homolog 2 [Populus alba]|uniref:Endoribonuclease Dicer-like 2-lik e n=1 Tax=Populus alba TaxID=43335 RepID=A0A4U5QBY9_POPAL|nr:endoribonuclease Dicer homolog 2 [Populus alba]TKS07642.1 endoribonuclease Dicer-like 2-lik e [Populus alba]